MAIRFSFLFSGYARRLRWFAHCQTEGPEVQPLRPRGVRSTIIVTPRGGTPTIHTWGSFGSQSVRIRALNAGGAPVAGGSFSIQMVP